jgi:hypothetical protein
MYASTMLVYGSLTNTIYDSSLIIPSGTLKAHPAVSEGISVAALRRR